MSAKGQQRTLSELLCRDLFDVWQHPFLVKQVFGWSIEAKQKLEPFTTLGRHPIPFLAGGSFVTEIDVHRTIWFPFLRGTCAARYWTRLFLPCRDRRAFASARTVSLGTVVSAQECGAAGSGSWRSRRPRERWPEREKHNSSPASQTRDDKFRGCDLRQKEEHASRHLSEL